jgi:carboxymethylenebutenolidase
MIKTTSVESWVSIPVGPSAGAMDAFLVQPEGARGAVVLLQEIFGVNEAMRAKARDLAAAGYTVLVPDLFWRLERRVDLGYGESDRQRGFALMQKFDQVLGAADARASSTPCATASTTRRRRRWRARGFSTCSRGR